LERNSPKVVVFALGSLILLFGGLFGAVWMIDKYEDTEIPDFKKAIAVTIDEIVPTGQDGTQFVVALAKVSNESDQAWERLHFQFDFSDEKGETIDNWIDHDYDLVLPPRGEIRFRVSRSALRPAEQYVSATVTVVSASRFQRFGR